MTAFDLRKFETGGRLRVGVISDSQLTPYPHKRPTTFERNLLASFRTLKAYGCDMIVFAGDICNRASKNGYKLFKRCLDTAFPGDKPIVQAIMGNHDYYFHPAPRRLFERELGQKPLTHFVVNGVHFIGASPDSPSMHRGYSETRKFIAERLAAVEAEGGTDPVFVITHNAPRSTVYGSEAWGDDSLTGVFDEHPRVVSLSGHTHFSLLHPESFWRGGFTALGTQSVSYTELEKGKVNGSVPPRAYAAPMGYILEFGEDEIAVLRVNMLTGTEQLSGDRIVISRDGKPARRVDARRSAVPVFGEGEGRSEVTAEGTKVSFPRAEGAVAYELAYPDGEKQLYFSDFYLGDEAEGDRQSLIVYGRRRGECDIAVTAVGAGGERSESGVLIKGVRVIRRRYRRKLAPEIWY